MEISNLELYRLLNSQQPLWLAGIDLSNANLVGCNFEKANLQGAILSDSNLCGANLQAQS